MDFQKLITVSSSLLSGKKKLINIIFFSTLKVAFKLLAVMELLTHF